MSHVTKRILSGDSAEENGLEIIKLVQKPQTKIKIVVQCYCLYPYKEPNQ